MFHIGADQAPWILRASRLSDEEAHLFMVQLVAVERRGMTSLASPEPLALSDFIPAMADGFVVVDREGVVRNANPAFLNLIQVSHEAQALGLGLGQWLSAPDEDLPRLLAAPRGGGGRQLVTTTLRGERGRDVRVEMSAGADRSEDPAYVAIVVRDISRRSGRAEDVSGLPALPALLTRNDAPLRTSGPGRRRGGRAALRRVRPEPHQWQSDRRGRAPWPQPAKSVR